MSAMLSSGRPPLFILHTQLPDASSPSGLNVTPSIKLQPGILLLLPCSLDYLSNLQSTTPHWQDDHSLVCSDLPYKSTAPTLNGFRNRRNRRLLPSTITQAPHITTSAVRSESTHDTTLLLPARKLSQRTQGPPSTFANYTKAYQQNKRCLA